MTAPAPVHVYQTFIRASADQVWRAITDPDFTTRYFHRTAFESTLEPGSPYRMILPDGSDAVVGAIEEVEPNKRLVMTWRTLYDAAAAEEPPSRVEWLLTEGADGVTKVTTIHRDLGLSPVTSAGVADGWVWVLQSMKSLIETGEALPGSEPEAEGDGDRASASVEEAEAEVHRRQGITANNSTWELLDGRQLSADEVDDVLGRAYAAMYHWQRAARRGPENAARDRGWCPGSTPCSATATSPCTTPTGASQVVEEAGLDDFDLAYAHEARARALACLGRLDEAAVELKAAHAVPIADPEDKAILDADLASDPWYGLTI